MVILPIQVIEQNCISLHVYNGWVYVCLIRPTQEQHIAVQARHLRRPLMAEEGFWFLTLLKPNKLLSDRHTFFWLIFKQQENTLFHFQYNSNNTV